MRCLTYDINKLPHTNPVITDAYFSPVVQTVSYLDNAEQQVCISNHNIRAMTNTINEPRGE